MACRNEDAIRFRLFNKIKLLNDIANQLIYFGMQYGHTKLMEKVDMLCGAIPEGEFEQVIDLNSPDQFLSLYMQISENRFAMAATELLKMSPEFIKPILDFCGRVGKDLKADKPLNAKDAFSIVENYVLDGMPGNETKQIKIEEENTIVWEKITDTHQAAWEKAGGDLKIYYKLQQQFINGLFIDSGFEFLIENDSKFIIRRKG